jgi:hypothetical protein
MSSFDRLRRAALALPQVVEGDHFGGDAFLVGKKTFALWSVKEGRTIMKLPPHRQIFLFEVRPKVFQPCRVGVGTWSFVDLEALDDAEVDELTHEAWTTVVTKALARTVSAPGMKTTGMEKS